jgi:hypothetical protein
MVLRTLAWLPLLLLAPLAAEAGDCFSAVSSRVTAVKIHGNNAEVTREFELTAYEPGAYCVVHVDGLTAKLEDKSVRVKGVGAAEIIESSVAARSVPRAANPAYTARLDHLRRLLQLEEAGVEACKAGRVRAAAQQEYVELFTRASIRGSGGKRTPEHHAAEDAAEAGKAAVAPAALSVQSLAEILTFQDTVGREMDLLIAAARQEHSRHDAHIEAIQSRIAALQNKGVYTPYLVDGKLFCPPGAAAGDCDPSLAAPAAWPAALASKSVEVRIRTAPVPASAAWATTPLKFSITYLAGPARWYPEYDIRLEGNAAGGSRQYLLEIDYYAGVEQQTQEVGKATYEWKLGVFLVILPPLNFIYCPYFKHIIY